MRQGAARVRLSVDVARDGIAVEGDLSGNICHFRACLTKLASYWVQVAKTMNKIQHFDAELAYHLSLT